MRSRRRPHLDIGRASSREDAALGLVIAVSAAPGHGFSETQRERIRLLAGLGVEGDGHLGDTVQHRSRVAADPVQPNLRQVHLIHAELHEELISRGFSVVPGALGENVTTRGVDMLSLPTRTRLHLGDEAVVELTGVRNPCLDHDEFAVTGHAAIPLT